MTGIIYKLTNTINNKIYIGQTTADREYKRQYEHKMMIDGCRYLNFAINKYGWESFNYETLYKGDCTIDELNDLETKFIEEYQSTNSEIGYNICLGGNGTRGHKLIGTAGYEGASKTMFKKGEKPWNVGVPITEEQRQKNKEKAHKKKVAQYTLDGELINTFDSVTDAALSLGDKRKKSNISACCLNKYDKAYGYKWQFID